MKIDLTKPESKPILSVGDIFITQKGNPHIVIKNQFHEASLQVMKVNGSKVIKCFYKMKDIEDHYDIKEIIKSSEIKISRI